MVLREVVKVILEGASFSDKNKHIERTVAGCLAGGKLNGFKLSM